MNAYHKKWDIVNESPLIYKNAVDTDNMPLGIPSFLTQNVKISSNLSKLNIESLVRMKRALYSKKCTYQQQQNSASSTYTDIT